MIYYDKKERFPHCILFCIKFCAIFHSHSFKTFPTERTYTVIPMPPPTQSVNRRPSAMFEPIICADEHQTETSLYRHFGKQTQPPPSL